MAYLSFPVLAPEFSIKSAEYGGFVSVQSVSTQPRNVVTLYYR